MINDNRYITFAETPDLYSFLCNLRPIVVNCIFEVTASLSITVGEVVHQYNLSYIPDSFQQIRIDVVDIAKSLFDVKFNNEIIFLQNEFMAHFDVEITSPIVEEYIYTEFYVFNVQTQTDIPTLDWLKKTALTVQPQIRSLDFLHPDFLSYFAKEDSKLAVRFYKKVGNGFNFEDVALQNISAETAITYRIDYERIWFLSSFPSLNRFSYFDLFVKDGNDRIVSYFYRYVFRSEKDNLHFFYFANSKGGIDRFACSGPLSFAPELSHEIAERNNRLENIPQYRSKKYKQESGSINKEHYLAAFDFLTSDKIFHFNEISRTFSEIVLEKSSIEFPSKENFGNFSFTFCEKINTDVVQDLDYINLPIYELPTPSVFLNILKINNESQNVTRRLWHTPIVTFLQITSSSPFTITKRGSNNDWITATPNTGTGTAAVRFTASENETQEERTVIFDIVNAEGQSLSATFTQLYLQVNLNYITLNNNKITINNQYVTL